MLELTKDELNKSRDDITRREVSKALNGSEFNRLQVKRREIEDIINERERVKEFDY